MKKLILVSTFIIFAITSSFAFQSPVTCSVESYDGAGATASQYVTVQQDCDIALEAEISTVGFAVAQYGSTYAYASSQKTYDARVVTSVSAGSTIYLSAMVANNGSGWCYARVSFGRYH